MNNEDMRMQKFAIVVKDLEKYLGSTGISSKGSKGVNTEEDHVLEDINPLEFFIDKSEGNVYKKIVFDNTFKARGVGLLGRSFCFELDDVDKNDIMELVERMRKCNNCSMTAYNKPSRCNVPYHLLFWMIFTLGIDNKTYNNDLNVIADTAYVLQFNEEMLKDWINAVKAVFQGEKLNEIDYKTEQGRKFFIR